MEQVMLDMIPTGAKAVCHVSQYDIGRTIRFNLRSGGAAYTLAGTETVKVYIKKPDGTTAERNIANTSSTYVDWVTGEGDCDQAGKCECELVITSGTTVIGSKNFTVKIEEDPYNEQGVVTETAGPAVIATFTTNVVDLLQEVKCEINAMQDLHGYDHPWAGGAGKNKISANFNDWTSGSAYSYTYMKIPHFSNQVYNMSFVDKDTSIDISGINIGFMHNYPYENTKYRWVITSAGVQQDKTNVATQDGITNCDTIIIYPNTKSAFDKLFARFDIQVEVGSTATAYEPYSNICPISGFDELNIQQTGANLWDEQWEQGGINGTTGANNNESGCIRSKNYIRVYPNQTLYFKAPATWNAHSIRGRCYKADGTYLQTLSFLDNTVFTIPTDCYLFRFVTPSGADVTTYGNDISINYPATDTQYHAYSGKLIKLEFDDTVYLAEVSCLNGVWKLKLLGAEVDLGSLDWTPYNDTFYAQLPDAYMPESSTTMPNIICENYSPDTLSHILSKVNDNTIGLNSSQARAHIYDSSKSSMTGAQFKTAMSGIKAVYEIATPVEITLDETEQFEALLGINNVWHDGNGDTEVKYLYNA